MKPIIDAVRTQLAERGRWELSADEVRELLGLDHATFYRRLYEAAVSGHALVDVSATTARYDDETVGELVSVLELFVGSEAQRALEEAGIFLSHEARFEITRRTLRRGAEAARAHSIERDTFAAMLDRLGSYRRARGAYLDEYFPMADLIEGAAADYVASRPFTDPKLARASVERLLEHYVARHVLERETLFAGVAARLFEIAVELGFARRPEEEWAEAQRERERAEAAGGAAAGGAASGGAGGDGRSSADPEQWARGVMELGEGAISESRLKSAYKSLMKRYHPDVNPRGLRICQRVNEAYALLLATTGDST